MSDKYPKSVHDLSVESIVRATYHANLGQSKDSEHHVEMAKIYADLHTKRLESQGRAAESENYLAGLGEHISRITALASRRSMEKAEAGENDMQKGFDVGSKTASPARKEFSSTGHVATTMKLKNTPAQKGYAYKQFHELHADDQAKVPHQYGGGADVARYSYPTHHDTGRLASAGRTKNPESSTGPRPEMRAFQGHLPEHKAGATVRINSPEFKNKLGIVRQASPYYPGKIAVQIGARDHEKVFVEPHHVSISTPSSKIEKALITLHSIRKAFLK